MEEPIEQRIVVSRVALPVIVSLRTDTDDKIDALAAMVTDCAAFVAGEISFLELLESFTAFTQTVDESRHANAI